MTSAVASGYKHKSTDHHPFDAYVAQEALDAVRTHLLFAPHILDDVSHVKTEQKNGNDFLLRLLSDEQGAAPIRIENKFEQYCTGNVTFEYVSCDRPRIAPGWVFTSKAGWLLSWFPTGEVLCWPMQELREYLLGSQLTHVSTTALNKRYLSWSRLERISELLTKMPNARVLKLGYEIGETPEVSKSLVYGAARSKICTCTELIELMRKMPRESSPVPQPQEELVEHIRALSLRNLKRNTPSHRAYIEALPVHWQIPVDA